MPRIVQIATAVIQEGEVTNPGHYLYALDNTGEVWFSYLGVDGRSDWHRMPPIDPAPPVAAVLAASK